MHLQTKRLVGEAAMNCLVKCLAIEELDWSSEFIAAGGDFRNVYAEFRELGYPFPDRCT
jgi:hypothetical protein